MHYLSSARMPGFFLSFVSGQLKIHRLLAYRPWQSESEEASANRPGPENVWVR
jgi:hypothetical protein